VKNQGSVIDQWATSIHGNMSSPRRLSKELVWVDDLFNSSSGALTGRSQADRLQGQMAGLLCSGGPLSERSDGLAQRPLRSGEKTPPPSCSSQT
jgi:hypothetical protein